MITLNPINQQRWQRFKHNRRGYYALWLFIILLILSLLANVIANDKPLLIRYQQQFYTPLWKTYSETTFGGEFLTEPDYRNPELQAQIKQHGWIIWAPIKQSYSTLNFSYQGIFPSPPSAQNWLGTDGLGRDVFANLLYGFRISIIFGFLLTFFSSLIGISVGAILGYYGGKIDLLGQRFVEIWSGMPTLFLLILLSSVVTPNFYWLLAITVLFGWMTLVNVVRAEFLRTRNFDYVRAAKAMGIPDRLIIWRHILPNATIATVTFLPFILCGSITTLTSLDFLGFGLPLDYPSLGRLLLEGKNNLQAPWLGSCAFLIIAVMLSLLLFIGEGVRDALAPQRRG